MSNNIVTELQYSSDVYDICGKGGVNHNGSNSGTPFVYDWIGTAQQYDDQNIETLHPDWVCYITDDVEGGLSVYTKSEIDTAFIHKELNEIITGTKTFRSNANQVSLVTKSQTIDNTQTPGSNIFSNFIDGVDKNDVLLSRIFTEKQTNGENAIAIQAHKGNTQYQAVVTSDGNCLLPPNVYTNDVYADTFHGSLADLAEKYQSDQKYPTGTLIKFGGEKDITIANDKCNGVISDRPGYILDNDLDDAQPIALSGKTPVRIIGEVNKNDPITLSEIPGVGRIAKENEKIIARTLQSSNQKEEKLVMCVTKFNLD